MRRPVIPILLLFVTFAVPLGAGEGKFPVWMPTVITQPGHYVLTRDISATAGPVVSIQTDGVTLDLNGHTIDQYSTTDPAITITGATGQRGIIIVGGRVWGGTHGILHIPPDPQLPLSLSDLTIAWASQAAVRGVGFGQLSAQGILIIGSTVGFDLLGSAAGTPPPPFPPKATIHDADIRAGGGVHCDGVVCSVRDTSFQYHPPDPQALTPAVSFCNIDGGEAVGIIVVDTMPAGGIIPCTIEMSAARGIMVIDSLIQRPPGRAGGGDCIEADAMTADIRIEGNTLAGCGGDGIRALGTRITTKGNVITGAAGHGIFAGGTDFIIDDDKITGSAGAGIWFQTGGHVYRGNVLRGNTGGAVAGPGSTSVVDGGGNIP